MHECLGADQISEGANGRHASVREVMGAPSRRSSFTDSRPSLNRFPIQTRVFSTCTCLHTSPATFGRFPRIFHQISLNIGSPHVACNESHSFSRRRSKTFFQKTPTKFKPHEQSTLVVDCNSKRGLFYRAEVDRSQVITAFPELNWHNT
ncbi:unnamed protein product [Acanthoscelides obtectus]|uniref:Uncharacterized protein n=1 Tax=Acanthoscelides obtectus TaxID=200917 RepID=A0A9P0JS82_ACAOB|nr:unnamed protein product [Acanthoscelides obtectus]CAK1663769.1 hypothetical protein AOBTE_LOCUS23843 [Acanthoscelides obtectus]